MFEQLPLQVINRAKAQARDQGFAVCLCVVDDAGLLRHFVHMDNAVPDAISLGGGVVLRDDQGKVIGAVGVASATVEVDQVIAQQAADRP